MLSNRSLFSSSSRVVPIAFKAIGQWIGISWGLTPRVSHFDRAETEKYILSHLVYAGGRQDIFTDRALDDIYKESTGIPRRINRICEKSLMYASQQGKRLIDEHLVRYIIEHEMLGGDV